MFNIRIEFFGKNKTVFVEFGVHRDTDLNESNLSNNALPDTTTLKRIEDEWVQECIIV